MIVDIGQTNLLHAQIVSDRRTRSDGGLAEINYFALRQFVTGEHEVIVDCLK